MEKVLFAMLLVGTGVGVGLSGVLAWMHFRLAYVDPKQGAHIAHAVTKIGYLVTNGVLLWALAQAGTARASGFAWFYLAGLVTLTAGLALQTKDMIVDLARADVQREDQTE